MLNSWVFFCWFLFVIVGFSASGEVVLSGKNFTFMFPDTEANFAPSVKGSGKCGVLYVADPLDACSPLLNKIVDESKSPFVLIVRGNCSFEDKVRTAETAGFEAVIVYNNEEGDLISMAGNSEGINIHALFVSKNAGDTLLQYSAATAVDIDLWIIPSTGTPDWSILTISFVSVIAMSVVLTTCFFVRRHQIRRDHLFQAPNLREFHGLSSHLVKAMPSLIFTSASEDNSTSSTCAICLEDYTMGERLRVLPCDHKFHVICVDTWLTSWRTFCPICKHDLRNAGIEKPASESTPLLVSRPSSSSMRLPFSAPGGMHTRASSSSHSSSVFNNPSVSSSYHIHSLRSYSSPHLTRSRASRFDNSFLPLPLPNNMGSPSNASSLLQYTESESPPNSSPITSAQSLPEC